MARFGREIVIGSVVALSACTVDSLIPLGRPCSSTEPCGPEAICDPARGICVGISLDRGPLPGDGARSLEAGASDGPGRESGLDRQIGDLPPPPDLCPSGLSLCGSACVDLATSSGHCGKCDTPCVAPGADRCVGGKCVCGTTGATCPPPSVCLAGACDTNPCLGKGDGTTCDDGLYCTVNDLCKSSLCGGAPRDCGSMSSTCTEGACDEALDQCVAKPRVSGTPCAGGQCHAGSCCTGCWNGSTCVGGSSAAACGDHGDLCLDCTGVECRSSPGTSCNYLWYDTCSTLGAKSDGSSCTGGKCLDGACCTGCRDGDHCRPGTYPGQCGAAGSPCQSCLSECRTGSTCAGGVCVDPNKPDGTACTSGKCLAGGCCTGCISGSTCYSGTSTSHCGDDGGSCKSCPATTLVCKKATCTSGNCGVGNADGTSCTGGTCVGGVCCKGCVSAGVCRTGTETAYCGAAGAACLNCTTTAQICSGGACVTP